MEKTVTTTLRLPEGMLAKLKHMAVDNRRSLNNELLTILESALKQKEQVHANAGV